MHHRHSTTPAHRVRLASHMIAHQGTYGLVSQLSREHQISRQALYTLKSRGQEAMERKLSPTEHPTEGEVWIERAVLTLFTEGHTSREGIQQCIEEMLGVHVSTGKISAIIHEAGRRAQVYLKRQIPKGKRALALDEQYGSERGKAYLNIVDVLSSLVVASIPPVAVDGESWILLLWQMQQQGLQWKLIVSDGGKAIQDAVNKVAPDQVYQRDVWHVLHECQKVQGRVDREVVSLHEQTPKVERQAKRVAAGKKPLGRKPKTDVRAHTAELHQMEYVASSLRYLTFELQRLLSIVVLTRQGILASAQRQEELNALCTLFVELCEVTPPSMKNEVKRLFHHVQLALPSLVSYSLDLDAVLQRAIDQLGEAAVHLIGWAWLRRTILQPKTEKLAADFAPAWQPVVAELFGAWDEAVRSSSAVENWHSVLRPFIAVHRSLSADMLAILAVWHNHRVPSRGLHQGQSPLMRSDLAKEPTDWFVALGYPSASSSPGQAQSSIVSSEPKMESIAA
ncbi:MAG TPA: transposase [Ktedonobacteraceae bacterium]